MASKKFDRITRTRKLTPQEAARDEEIRRKVQAEFPPADRAPLAGPRRLSEALRAAIRKSGKTVYQIGKEADVAPIVIARFLSGERDIRMATADRLADVLGLTLPTE